MRSPAGSSHPGTGRGWGAAVVIVGVGLAIRLGLAAVTLGTNDVTTWRRFGFEVLHYGLAAAYQIDPELVHPPAPTLWATGAVLLSGTSERAFAFLMKLPAISADVVACWLLWRIGWRRRSGSAPGGSMMTGEQGTSSAADDRSAPAPAKIPPRASGSGGFCPPVVLVALWALNPLAILVSGYHGNTDNVYALLVLLAFDLLDRRRFLAA
ncbi:MAG: hypothetical protein NZ561_11680, partial [Phycisphaerae bacterium]|nr:hypothetical protein [Phycisphaerae bacterium]